MMNKKIIAVLVVAVALVVGYVFYRSPAPTEPQKPVGNKSEPVIGVKELTAEEKAVLKVPGPNASLDENKKYFSLVDKIAVTTSTLNIAYCIPHPVAVRIENGKELTVKNGSEYEVSFDIADKNYKIPAKSNIQLKANFGKGGGIYGYACNTQSPETSGTGTGLILLTVEDKK